METIKLSDEEIQEKLKSLPGWVYEHGSIKKVFETKSYPASMGFVTAIGGVCQRYNHHPDYILMKYRQAEVSFSTHSAGGVTEKDFVLAGEIEKLLIL
jgi:4a-hydroxytetrahydrobiopterin dehydratase